MRGKAGKYRQLDWYIMISWWPGHNQISMSSARALCSVACSAPAPVAWGHWLLQIVPGLSLQIFANTAQPRQRPGTWRHVWPENCQHNCSWTVFKSSKCNPNIPLMHSVWALLAPIVMSLPTKRLSELDSGQWQPRPVLSLHHLYQLASPVSFVISGLQARTWDWHCDMN